MLIECIDNINNGEKIMGLEIGKEYKANKEFTLNIMGKQTTFVEIKTIYGLKNIEKSKFEEKKPMYRQEQSNFDCYLVRALLGSPKIEKGAILVALFWLVSKLSLYSQKTLWSIAQGTTTRLKT